MQQISRITRAAPARIPTARLAPRISFMAPLGAVPQKQAISLPSPSRTYGTTSSPKQAEDASAQSGGSRSKEASESGSSPTGGTIEGGGPPQQSKPTGKSDGKSPTEGVVPDALADGDVRGRTGGGKPLDGSHGAPKPPKVDSHSLPGGDAKLTKEQQAEVDDHNKDFDAKHGRAEPAQEDKVDPKFWSNKGKETGAV